MTFGSNLIRIRSESILIVIRAFTFLTNVTTATQMHTPINHRTYLAICNSEITSRTEMDFWTQHSPELISCRLRMMVAVGRGPWHAA